jgi:hypothetical protein
MSTFQHPHLTRGVIKTPNGAFVVSRGLVEMPDDIGESLGWLRVDRETQQAAEGPDTPPRSTRASL